MKKEPTEKQVLATAKKIRLEVIAILKKRGLRRAITSWNFSYAETKAGWKGVALWHLLNK